jgi:hypothetical protein
LLDALRDSGNVAGTLAKFVPYVQASYALLDFFGLLGKKGAVEPALQQRFAQIQINKILIAQDQKWTEVKANEAQNTVRSHETRLPACRWSQTRRLVGGNLKI